MAPRVVVTGANAAIGRALLSRAFERGDQELVALVRSARAAAQLPALPPALGRVEIADYADPESMRRACAGAQALIHLPGLLVETRESPYERANVRTTRSALAAARAEGLQKVVLLSACGADPRSRNRFFRSKGEAEELVRGSSLAYTILRCPLVLGCDSAGDRALARQARAHLVFLLGSGRALEQPIAAADVADGLLGSARDLERARDRTLELVGPECLSLRELVGRAARITGARPAILPLPIALARAGARLRRGGITPDVIEVLIGHEPHDPGPAARELGIELTPLEGVLRRSLGARGPA